MIRDREACAGPKNCAIGSKRSARTGRGLDTTEGEVAMRTRTWITLVAAGLMAGGCSLGLQLDPRDKEIKHSMAAGELARLNLSHGGFESLLDRQTAAGVIAMRPVFETVIGRQLSDRENDQLRELYRRVILEVYPRPLWEAAISDIYVKYMTAEEIEAILDFYDTAAGSKLVRLHSTLQRETAEAGEKLMQSRRTEFGRRVGIEFREGFQ